MSNIPRVVEAAAAAADSNRRPLTMCISCCQFPTPLENAFLIIPFHQPRPIAQRQSSKQVVETNMLSNAVHTMLHSVSAAAAATATVAAEPLLTVKRTKCEMVLLGKALHISSVSTHHQTLWYLQCVPLNHPEHLSQTLRAFLPIPNVTRVPLTQGHD